MEVIQNSPVLYSAVHCGNALALLITKYSIQTDTVASPVWTRDETKFSEATVCCSLLGLGKLTRCTFAKTHS